MATLSITDLRNVDWDLSTLWEVKFNNTPSPFNNFNPVIDVELNFGGLQHNELADTGYQFPIKKSPPSLTISYYDSQNLNFTAFFKEWMDDIAPRDFRGVKALSESTKFINIIKKELNGSNESIVYHWTFNVIPSSEIIYHGTSSADVPIYSLSFIVVGDNKSEGFGGKGL